MILSILLALCKVHESLSSTAVAPENSTCSATKRLYIDRACCGAQSNQAAICTAPNVNLSALGSIDNTTKDINHVVNDIKYATSRSFELANVSHSHFFHHENADMLQYLQVTTKYGSRKRMRILGTEVFENHTVKVWVQNHENPCIAKHYYVLTDSTITDTPPIDVDKPMNSSNVTNAQHASRRLLSGSDFCGSTIFKSTNEQTFTAAVPELDNAVKTFKLHGTDIKCNNPLEICNGNQCSPNYSWTKPCLESDILYVARPQDCLSFSTHKLFYAFLTEEERHKVLRVRAAERWKRLWPGFALAFYNARNKLAAVEKNLLFRRRRTWQM